MPLEHHVGVVAFTERSEPLVDNLLVALLQKARIAAAQVLGSQPDGCWISKPWRQKKTDVIQHRKVFNHAGILFNGSPGCWPNYPLSSLPKEPTVK